MLRRMLVLAFIAGGAWVAAGAGPAHASAIASSDACQEYDLADREAVSQRADAATDVFVGEVRSVEAVDGGRRPSNRTTEWRQRVTVTVAYRGAAQPDNVVRVVTEPSSDQGLGRLEVGATYLFFADREGNTNTLVASRCGGTTLLPDGLDRALRRDLQQVFQEPPPARPVEVTLTPPAGGTDEPPSLGRTAAPGLAISLVGLLGLLLFWRMGTRRP